MTSHKQTSLFTEEQLTSSQEDFLANPTAWPENGSAKKMNAIYGQRCLEQYERLPRATLWGKTFLASLIGTGEWFSTKCILTWSLRATKSRPWFYLRRRSMRRTEETGFGLWPTPDTIQRGRPEVAIAMKKANLPLYTRRDKAGTGRQFSIVDYAIYNGLLPTPTAMDSTGATANMKSTQARNLLLKTPCAADAHTENLSKKEQVFGNSGTLAQEVQTGFIYQRGLLPTPIAGDWKGQLRSDGTANMLCGKASLGLLPTPNQRDEKGPTGLPGQYDLNRELGITGRQLNPSFVAEMMGFPPNWTELPFQNGETSQLKHTETP